MLAYITAGARIVMETTAINENHDVGVRIAVIQLETEDEETSNTQEETTEAADNVLKSLSPLVNSMRLFGLYFTRNTRESPLAMNQLSQEDVGRCHGWNPARIYATIILIVMWVNAVRYHAIFYGIDTIGVELLMRLTLISSVWLIVFLQTAYYVASHTGSLDRVFRQMSLSAADIYPKYSRRAKLMTSICWTLVTFCVLFYIFPMFVNWEYSDEILLIFINTFHVSKRYAYAIAASFLVLEVQTSASWVFPQATNNSCLFTIQNYYRTFLAKVLIRPIIIVFTTLFILIS